MALRPMLASSSLRGKPAVDVLCLGDAAEAALAALSCGGLSGTLVSPSSDRRGHWARTCSIPAENVLDAGEVWRSLRTRTHGRCVVFAHCLASTQQTVRETRALPPGTLCVADVQSAGMGRGDNTWESPQGCLVFTLDSAVREGRTLPLVQYVACLAVVQAVKELEGMENVDVGIKWPNDVYVNRSEKIGGILCQSVVRGKDIRVSIGVGLNVDNEQPTTCLNRLAGKKVVTREKVLAEIVNKFEELHEEFEDPARGFSPRIQAEYEKHWMHTGQVVVLESEGNRQVVVQGIAPEAGGCLLAKAPDDGAMFELYPDGNRFDFFKGLISRKVK